MTISNIRFGFATNSSSTHSLVFVKNKSLNEISSNCGDFQYGWDWFVLREKNSKLRYLATAFKDMFEPEELGKVVGYRNITNADYSYVDHQSAGMLTGWVHTIDDLVNLRDFILSEDVAIRGGNDNGDIPFTLINDLIPISVNDIVGNNILVRPDGNAKVYFNKDSGLKIRLTSDNSQYEKSSYPELVDLKITDWCDKDCLFCYQGSSREGKHGNTKTIKSIIKKMDDAGVFEIAFGGGEPTAHPNFIEILEYTRSLGIVPNATTKNVNIFNNFEKGKKILDLVGGIAISVGSLEEIKAADEVLQRFHEKAREYKYYYASNKLSYQIVLGTIEREEFEAMISYLANDGYYGVKRITLLGYKTTGRGKDVAKINYDWWLESVVTKGIVIVEYNFDTKKADTMNLSSIEEYLEAKSKNFWDGSRPDGYTYVQNKVEIGIDTSIAYEYKEQLEHAGIEKMLFNVVEGAFSCYIDGVNKLIAPSSYCESEEFRPFDNNWVKTYQSFGVQEERPNVFHVDVLPNR